MWDTSARLLRLLSLLQTRRAWTGAELADRLGIDIRTVRRDIDKLRTLGYPVDTTPGVAGYRLGAGANVPPLLLDDDEAIAVAVGLRAAASGAVTGIEESSLRALTKLEQVLPSRLWHRVNLLHKATVSVPGTGPAVDPGTLTTLARVCLDHHRLRFDYERHDGEPSTRSVEPHRLVHTGRHWYLVAWDLDRDDWRTYRVDRMRPRVPTGPRFTPRPPPDDDLARYLMRGVTGRVYRYRARITLYTSAERAADHFSPGSGVIEAVDARTCVLHTGSNSLDEIALFVGLSGVRFHVHEPPELVRHIHDLAARLAEANR